MTAEQAIKRIKESRDYQYTHYGFVNSDGVALDMAIEALEKQIPKKINPNFNCVYCDCGNAIYYETDRCLHHYNYCCECGQKLRWE